MNKTITLFFFLALPVLMGISCGGDETAPVVPPPGPGCRTLSDYTRVTGVVRTGGSARRAALDGDLVYVAGGTAGLVVLDADGLRGSVAPGAGSALDVATMAPGMALVAWGSEGAAVVDTGDPDRPIIVGRLPTAGDALDVALTDSLAYIADDAVGLVIASLAEPARPRVLGVENTPGRASSVVVAGALAYVGDLDLGVRVDNVSDPSSPFMIRSLPTPGLPQALAVGGGFLYVADDLGGLLVVDVSNPGEEAIVSALDAGASVRDVSLDGTTLFVARGRDGVMMYDVTRPPAPQGRVRFGTLGSSEGVTAAAGRAVTCELSSGVRLVAADVPLGAPVLDREAPPAGDLVAVAARESLVVAADSTLGVRTFLSGPGGLVPQGTLALGGGARRVIVDGNRAFVARGPAGVEAVDVSSAATPVSLGLVPLSSQTTGMALDGNALYLARGSASLLEVDLTGASEPRGRSLNARFAVDAAVTATHVFVPARERQLLIVSRAFFDGPLAGYPLDGVPTRVVTGRGDAGLGVPLETDYAWVALRSGTRGPGVVALNLFNALSPSEVAFVATAGPAEAVALDDGRLYVALGDGGVEVFDVSDPGAAARLGFYPARHRVSDVAASNGQVLAADGGEGVFVAVPGACE